MFSNVPAVGAKSTTTGGASASGDIVTTQNFSETLSNNMVVRELLKDSDTAPSNVREFTASAATIRSNTESVYVNGMIQAVGADNDYTISGNTITFTYDIINEDAIYITYIMYNSISINIAYFSPST